MTSIIKRPGVMFFAVILLGFVFSFAVTESVSAGAPIFIKNGTCTPGMQSSDPDCSLFDPSGQSVEATWIDPGTIQFITRGSAGRVIGSEVFVDSNIRDGIDNFVYSAQRSNLGSIRCIGSVNSISTSASQNDRAKYTVKIVGQDQQCENSRYTLNVNLSNWSSASREIPYQGDIINTSGYKPDACSVDPNSEGCRTSVDPSVPDEPGDDGTIKNNDVCSGKLSWILCPVIDVAFIALDQLEGMINKLLFVDTNPIFNTQSNVPKDKDSATAYYQAWSGFRNIALGLIVIAALVIIIASAFGFDFLDAYTIRKAMPRLFIAVLAIAISWDLMEFLITLSNDIGLGIRALIYAPFVDADFQMIEFKTGETTFVALMISGGAAVFGLLGLLSFAISGILAMLLAFFVLVLREILIVVLVIMAPLGIAAFILPGTQKAYKLWENTLQVMLIAFPIISAMIAAGRVISAVAYDGGEASFLNTIIAYVAFIIPYFMMPFAFRWAGGVMATLGGLTNDKSRGTFDRLSKYRQGQQAKNLHNMKTGNRWQQGGALQKYTGINAAKRGLNFATSEGSIMAMSPGKRGEKRDLRRRMEAENIAKDPRFNAMKEDDNATRAMTYQDLAEAKAKVYEHLNKAGSINGRTVSDYGGTANFQAAARQEAERAANVVQSSVGFGRPQAILAAQQLANTGTGYRDLDDQAETIARVSNGNNSTAAQISGYNNFINKQKGRHDLAPGAGNLIQLAHGKMDQMKKGIPTTNESRAQLQSAWNSGSLYQWGNGKSKAMQNIADHHLIGLESNNREERENAAIALMEMQSMLPSASGENQKIIRSALRAANIDYEDTSMSIDEQIARRAEYGSAFRSMPLSPVSGGASSPDFNAEALRRKARVYDRDAELLQRNAGG